MESQVEPAPHTALERRLQIDDFYGSMPDIRDPEFATKLNSKQEFFELGAKAVEPFPAKGEMFNSQHYNRRYATYYDRILLAWDTGTGKSCAIAQIAEMLHEEYQKHPNDPTKIKKVIIVVNNTTLENNFRNEISCKCTDGIYDTEDVRKETDVRKQFKMIKKNMKEWYQFMTPTGLANAIRSRTNQNSLYEFMSNTMFVIDEVHTLPTLTDKKHRNVPKTAHMTVEQLLVMVDNNIKDLGKVETIYDTIFRAFHLGHRNKIVIATATRRINEPADTVYLINLLRPLHSLMPYADSDTYLAQGVEWFEHWTRGYISYLRVMKSPVTKDFQQRQITQSGGELVEKVNIYQVPMSMQQYYSYIVSDVGVFETFKAINVEANEEMNQLLQAAEKALEEEEEELDIQENENTGRLNFKMEPRNVLHFLYPNVLSGQVPTSSKGFQTYVKYSNYYDITLRPATELPQDMSSIENALPSIYEAEELKKATSMADYRPYLDKLSAYSAKMAKAVEVCLAAYIDETQLAVLLKDPLVKDDIYPFQGKGIGYIYFPDFVRGSGLYIFTLILQRFGYAEYRPDPNHLKASQTGGVCGATGAKDQLQNLSKARRFVKITGEMPENDINIIRNVVNASDNKFGQYIQLVVGSRKSGIGLSINNGGFMIQMESSWHYSKYFQALSRIFRITSHVDLINIAKERLAAYNQIHMENLTIDDITMKVPIYNLCSVYVPPSEPEIQAFLRNFEGLPEYELLNKIFHTENVNTADTMLYRVLARKEGPNATMNRWEKQVAYDSPVNRDRNIQVGDEPFSRECDFMECDYRSFGTVDVNHIDWTTKLLWHSEKEVITITQWVKDKLLTQHSLNFEEAIDGLGEIYDYDRLARARLFFVAIQNIVSNNIAMKDRFGMVKYIRVDDQGLIYLDSDVFSTGNNYRHSDAHFYNTSLLFSVSHAKNIFRDAVSNETSVEQNMVFYNNAMHHYTISQQGTEDAQQNLLLAKQELDRINDRVKELFLETAIKEVVSGNATPFLSFVVEYFGRHKIFTLLEPSDQLGKGGDAIKNETIYLLLKPDTAAVTAHEKISKFLTFKGDIRILKPSENIGWRNADAREKDYYGNFINYKRMQLRDYFREYYSVSGIYTDEDPTEFSILADEAPPKGVKTFQPKTYYYYNPSDGTTYGETKYVSMWKSKANKFLTKAKGKSHRNIPPAELIDILVEMKIYPPNYQHVTDYNTLVTMANFIVTKNGEYRTTMQYLFNDLTNASNQNVINLYYWWWMYVSQHGHTDLWVYIDQRFKASGSYIDADKLYQHVNQGFYNNEHFQYHASKQVKPKGTRGRKPKSTTQQVYTQSFMDPNVLMSAEYQAQMNFPETGSTVLEAPALLGKPGQ